MKGILNLLKKIFKSLKKVLAIALIALAVYFSFGGALVLFGITFSGVSAALLAGGLAFLVDAGTATEAVKKVGEAVGSAAGAAGAALGAAVGAAASGSGLLGLAALGVGAYLVITSEPSEEDKAKRASGPASGISGTIAYGRAT